MSKLKYNATCEGENIGFYKRDPACQRCDAQRMCEINTMNRLKQARDQIKPVDQKGERKKRKKETLSTYVLKEKTKQKPKQVPKKKFSFNDDVNSSKQKSVKKKKKFKLT